MHVCTCACMCEYVCACTYVVFVRMYVRTYVHYTHMHYKLHTSFIVGFSLLRLPAADITVFTALIPKS